MNANTAPAAHGVTVRTNAREARRLSALVSATRDFAPAARGRYFLPASDEVQALRDAEFLTDNGADVVSAV